MGLAAERVRPHTIFLRKASDLLTERHASSYANQRIFLQQYTGVFTPSAREIGDDRFMSKSQFIAVLPSRDQVLYWMFVVATAAVCTYKGLDAAGL